MVDVIEYFKTTTDAQRRADYAALAPIKAARDAAEEILKEASVAVVGEAMLYVKDRCNQVACIKKRGAIRVITCPHFKEDAVCRKRCSLHAANKKYVAVLKKYKVAQMAFDNFWDDLIASRQK